jgi:hypothetical protein
MSLVNSTEHNAREKKEKRERSERENKQQITNNARQVEWEWEWDRKKSNTYGLPCPEYKYRTISVNTSFVVS